MSWGRAAAGSGQSCSVQGWARESGMAKRVSSRWLGNKAQQDVGFSVQLAWVAHRSRGWWQVSRLLKGPVDLGPCDRWDGAGLALVGKHDSCRLWARLVVAGCGKADSCRLRVRLLVAGCG